MLDFLRSNRPGLAPRTRRSLLRGAFVFGALLPTLLVLALCVVTRTAWYGNQRRDAWQSRLSQQFGFQVKIDGVVEPGPGRFMLSGVQFFHPESDKKVFAIEAVFGRRNDAQWQIELVRPDFESDQLKVCWQSMHDWFICRPPTQLRSAFVFAKRLKVSGPRQREFEDIAIEYSARSSATRAFARFHLQNQSSEKPILLDINRQHRTESMQAISQKSIVGGSMIDQELLPKRGLRSTTIKLDTGDSDLQCELLASHIAGLERLGSRARFTGMLQWEVSDYWNWSVRSEGELSDVDFQTLTAGMPYVLTGNARFQVADLNIINGRLNRFNGNISADAGGTISTDLIHRLANHFLLHDRWPMEMNLAAYTYSHFDWKVVVDARGIGLGGTIQVPSSDEKCGLGIDNQIALSSEILQRLPVQRVAWLVESMDAGAVSNSFSQQLAALLPSEATNPMARSKDLGETADGVQTAAAETSYNR